MRQNTKIKLGFSEPIEADFRGKRFARAVFYGGLFSLTIVGAAALVWLLMTTLLWVGDYAIGGVVTVEEITEQIERWAI